MPRTIFDLNLLANMVAKLGNIVGQFGHTFTAATSAWSDIILQAGDRNVASFPNVGLNLAMGPGLLYDSQF